MKLVVYTQSDDSVPAVFDGLAVKLQPGSSMVVSPQIGVIGGRALGDLEYATIIVGDGGVWFAYPHAPPMESFNKGFGLGVGLFGFVLMIRIVKMLKGHSPDF